MLAYTVVNTNERLRVKRANLVTTDSLSLSPYSVCRVPLAAVALGVLLYYIRGPVKAVGVWYLAMYQEFLAQSKETQDNPANSTAVTKVNSHNNKATPSLRSVLDDSCARGQTTSAALYKCGVFLCTVAVHSDQIRSVILDKRKYSLLDGFRSLFDLCRIRCVGFA